MEHNIKFLSLQKSELEYEVGLRGDTPADNVVELRKQITKLCRGFASEDILESHLDTSEDLKGVKESLIKSKNFLANLKSKFDKNLYLRTENLFNHIYHRLGRISPGTADEFNLLDEISKDYQTQTKDYLKLGPKIKISATSADVSIIDTGKELNTSTIAVTCDRGISTDLHKLKYDGKSCVRAFIQKVDEFILARNISPDKVLSFATEILTDNALHWYRSIQDSVYSWKDLTDLLKKDFGQFDYDYRLMAEIRSRSQGETENITIYLSIMHGMFSRLSWTVSEEEKLEILLHNIRPYYASTLASCPEIKSIDTLRTQCRNFENFQSRLLQFREPPRITTDTLAPEFAYNRPSSSQNKSYSNSMFKPNTSSSSRPIYDKNNYSYPKTNNNYSYPIEEVDSSLLVIDSKNSNNKFCPRCRTNDHSLKFCKAPKFLICFKCGKKDVTYPTCPNCVKPTNYPYHKN